MMRCRGRASVGECRRNISMRGFCRRTGGLVKEASRSHSFGTPVVPMASSRSWDGATFRFSLTAAAAVLAIRSLATAEAGTAVKVACCASALAVSPELALSWLKAPMSPRVIPTPVLGAAAGAAAVVGLVLPVYALPVAAVLVTAAYAVSATLELVALREGASSLEAQDKLEKQLQQAKDAAAEQQQLWQQQAQRQHSKVESLQSTIQQLQRDLKQAHKGGGKLDAERQARKQEESATQELMAKQLLLEHQLRQAQQQLAAAQEAAAHQAKASAAVAVSSRPGPVAAAAAAGVVDQQPAAAEAPAVPGKRVVAWVGGRAIKPSDRKLLPPDADVRFFGGSKDVGRGEMPRLLAALKAGSIHEVYMLIRWNGHGTTTHVSRVCKELGIPCHLISAGQKARLKAAAADSSDDERHASASAM